MTERAATLSMQFSEKQVQQALREMFPGAYNVRPAAHLLLQARAERNAALQSLRKLERETSASAPIVKRQAHRIAVLEARLKQVQRQLTKDTQDGSAPLPSE